MKPIIMIASNGDNQFYPTPGKLAGMMLAGVNWEMVETILEPSAGKGDLLKAAVNAFYANTKTQRSRMDGLEADCIEIDVNLRQILKYNFSKESIRDLRERYRELDRKWHRSRTNAENEEFKQLSRKVNAVEAVNMRIVHDDFLSYRGSKKYDIIIMNPPFANGDLHLLKALEMQKYGGDIICLLNAETLRNPFSKTRQLLKRKLEEYGAKITFVEDAFRDAERTANVDVAIIKVSIPKEQRESTIFERMRKAVEQEARHYENTDVIYGDFVERLISQFDIEVAAGMELIREYEALIPYILHDIPTESTQNSYNKPILSLRIGDSSRNGDATINEYLQATRLKYWRVLLNNEMIIGRLTSKLQDEYRSSVNKMADYDFSMFNISQILAEINSRIVAGVKDSIMDLFDRLTVEHSYYPESKANTHYFNGWKTNKAHKIGKKSILPVNGVFSSYSSGTFSVYQATSILSDIEKVLNYLDGRALMDVNLYSILTLAERRGQTRNIECKYFKVDFFKKGTMHIKFTDMEIVNRLNIYAAQNRNWLPPYYGDVSYDEMPDEGKAVIDSFQGEKAYSEVVANKGFYLADISSNALVMLAGA